MFNFFKKKQPVSREGIREDFKCAMAKLDAAEPVRRAAVGYGINLMNTAFAARFTDFASFQAQPHTEQTQYLKSLISAANDLAKKDPEVALGMQLHAMFIAALIENDRALMLEIGSKLAPISREGDLGDV